MSQNPGLGTQRLRVGFILPTSLLNESSGLFCHVNPNLMEIGMNQFSTESKDIESWPQMVFSLCKWPLLSALPK